MAYNFATEGYAACIKKEADVDTSSLRAMAVKQVRSFDTNAWIEDPVVSMIGERIIGSAEDTAEDTVDAFGKVNGKIRRATKEVVDVMMDHIKNFPREQHDLRPAVRAVEDEFFNPRGELAATLVANQALDFHKQDGFTEIEETNQALLTERRINDALLADEQAGKIRIKRASAFVGAVSNFSNFLDLCRKILRNIELGVPIVLLSRNNTTQHQFRYYKVLAALLAKHGVDSGIVAHLACSVEEQRRVLAANPDSAMYFTGSRPVAELIKQVLPKLMASTGGPNTMVAEALTPGVADAARMSHLIEHKGQCTAMRHLVVPGINEQDVEGKVFGSASTANTAADSMEAATFFNLLAVNPLTSVAPGYKTLSGDRSNIAVRHSPSLPHEIQEMWREAYLDVTAPSALTDDFISELAAWLNREQPISLALNFTDQSRSMELFERSSLVVYTVGYPAEKPALTCQARPQDGEVFGEVPPRRMLGRVSHLPVVVPSSTPGYNASYTQEYLAARGKEPFTKWVLPTSMSKLGPVVQRVKDEVRKGYCREVLAYLADAANGPRRGTGQRTALFGLQRPPLGTKVCIRLEKPASGSNAPHSDRVFDDLAPFLLPFIATNAKEQLVLSLDPYLAFPALPMLQQRGIKCVREEKAAFLKSEADFWHIIRLPEQAAAELPLVSHFVMSLVAFGHIKSTKSDDEAFVARFSQSAKWLRVETSASKL